MNIQGKEAVYINGVVEEKLDYQDNGKFTFHFFSEEATFNENLGEDDIEIRDFGTLKGTSQNISTNENGKEGGESSRRKPASVMRIDLHTLRIQMEDRLFAENCPVGYMVAVRDVATHENKYVVALAEITYPSYELLSNVEAVSHNAEGIDVLLTLAGTEYVDEVDKENIALQDGFQAMQIVSIEKKGENVLRLKAAGAIFSGEYGLKSKTGRIVVSANALRNSIGIDEVTVEVKIVVPFAFTNADGFRLVDNNLLLPVHLHACSFSDDVNAEFFTLSQNMPSLSIIDFSKTSASAGILSLSCPVEEINQAAKLLADGQVIISGTVINTGDKLSFDTTMLPARVEAEFDFIEEEDDVYKITVLLQVKNGTFKDCTEEAIYLGGDFQEARNIQLSKEQSELTFVIPAIDTIDTVTLSGEVIIDGTVILNNWGTNAETQILPLFYAADDSGRAGIALTSDTLYELLISTIKAAAGKAGTKAGEEIMASLGYDQLSAINDALTNITGQITTLTSLVTNNEYKRVLDNFDDIAVPLYAVV